MQGKAVFSSRITHRITEQRDALGRSTGYTYAKNDIPQQQTTIGYGADGRITSVGFTHQGEHKDFIYSYLPGTHLLHTLTHPNGLTLTQSYDPARDLPTQMDYTRAGALIVRRGYTYDILGRPTARHLARYGTETSDTFGYNTRSESPRGLGGGLDNARSGIAPKGRAGNGVPVSQLTSAHVNSADYSYAYDAIGNRAAAVENSSGVASRTEYRTNNLNQYTAEGSFTPAFDADGNQTLIKTSTGIWSVTYNAKNRPVLFTKSDGSATVECTYDTMGRRATKKVTTNGSVTEHRRFLYRGYLQIACCDLTRAYTPALWYILWESPRGFGGGLDNAQSGIAPKGRAGNGVPASHPTQPTATRPLAIQKNGTWYTYGWDLTKNICETYRTDGRIDLAYTYTPYGEVSPAHTYDQPLRWSSEYHDTELGLVYYNYRHYNPAMGRWMGRDMAFSTLNLYHSFINNPSYQIDILGNWNDGLYGGNGDKKDRGHSDFPGQGTFDYTKADKDPATCPENPASSYLHFMPLIESEIRIVKDIKNCDKDSFEYDMHYMQDFFAHYGQGFRAPAPIHKKGVDKIKDQILATVIAGDILGKIMHIPGNIMGFFIGYYYDTEIMTIGRGVYQYGDFGHLMKTLSPYLFNNNYTPDDAEKYEAAFWQAWERSQHWVEQWECCCNNIQNKNCPVIWPDPANMVSAAPPTHGNPWDADLRSIIQNNYSVYPFSTPFF